MLTFMFSWIFLEVFVWGLICSVCISYEKGWAAFWFTLLGIVGAKLLGYDILVWIWLDPAVVVKYALIYIAIGAVWGSFKFIWKLRKARNTYIKDKTKWLNGKTIVSDDPAKARTEEQWIEHCKDRIYNHKEMYAPTVSANKFKIILWMTWWPFSVIAFFFDDLLTEVWNGVWKIVKGFLEAIRKYVLGEAAKDLD